MRVDTIMSRQIASCAPHDSLERAAQLMWEHDCGCLPVCQGDGTVGLVGIITDRDICMSAMFQGKPLKELRVDTAMAHSVQTCRPEESLADAERKMQEARVRRLPVTAEDGTLLGLISMADLAREATRQARSPRHELSSGEVCSTLAAICSATGNQLAA